MEQPEPARVQIGQTLQEAPMMDRFTARALVETGQMSSEEYLRLFGEELRAARDQLKAERETQKRELATQSKQKPNQESHAPEEVAREQK